MIVKAFKHEPTGQLFEREVDYLKCKEKYEEREQKRREKARLDKEWYDLINKPRLTATSLEDFRKKVIVLWNTVHSDKGLVMETLNFNVQLKTNITDNYRHPIGKPVMTEDKKYISYTGWTGSVSGTLNKWKSISGSELCRPDTGSSFGDKIPGLNAGGGGGTEKFQYSCTFYIDDFPLIYKQYEERLIDRDRLVREISERQEQTNSYDSAISSYIYSDKGYTAVREERDKIEMEIKRLMNAKSILDGSLLAHSTELKERYEKENFFDRSVLPNLRQQLVYVNQQLGR